jgi:hypothetical protein
MTTHVAADLAVTLAENRPGALARAISTIAAAGINIDGYAEMSGVVHVLTTELAAARQRLAEAGFREVQEQDVVVVPVENEPGAAAGVFQRIADAHINVRYSYMATGNRLVIASSNAQAVLDALGER